VEPTKRLVRACTLLRLAREGVPYRSYLNIHPVVNSDRKRALAIVRLTVAIANSNTGNFDFLSTLISKAARAG
jgi:hypothetical protein